MHFSRSSILAMLLLVVPAYISAYSTFTGQRMSTQGLNAATMTMKKGKPNVPPQMRSAYKRNQELSNQRQQMQDAMSYNPADGLPVFQLFVRSQSKAIWYPCGTFKGDERSAALAKSVADNGFLSGISKSQLDKGVSGSLFRDLDKLKQSIIRGYPQLKNKELEFGYKLTYADYVEEKVGVIEVKEQKSFLDGLFGN